MNGTATVRAIHSHQASPGQTAVAETVRLVRQRRGFTLAQLAAQLNKQPAWASRVEHKHIELRGRNLADCAAALNVPAELLCTPITEADLEGVHFRKYRVPKKVEDRAAAEANFVAYLVNTLLEVAGQDTAPTFCQIDTRMLADTPREAGVAAATLVRRHWGLGTRPLKDLAQRIEREGVFIAPLPADISKVSAITTWHGTSSAPITLLSNGIADDTRRFTLAHEFGHLVMDATSGRAEDKDVEERANAFAGELLAPYEQLRPTLQALNIGQFSTLLQLQQTWGLHPAAFIQRGVIAGDISPSAQGRWYRELNGTRRNQVKSLKSPYPLRMTAIGELLAMLKSVDWTAATLARHLHVHVAELAAVLDGWPFNIGITPPQPAPPALAAVE